MNNNCKTPEMCIITPDCIPCDICPNRSLLANEITKKAVGDSVDRLVRRGLSRLWEWWTGESLVVMTQQREDMMRLNSYHCEWLKQHEATHPELCGDVQLHNWERVRVLHGESVYPCPECDDGCYTICTRGGQQVPRCVSSPNA